MATARFEVALWNPVVQHRLVFRVEAPDSRVAASIAKMLLHRKRRSALPGRLREYVIDTATRTEVK